jgi:superfamily II DNA helicase RecQ
MRICIRDTGQEARPLTIEVYGFEAEVSGLPPGAVLTVSAVAGGISAVISGGEEAPGGWQDDFEDSREYTGPAYSDDAGAPEAQADSEPGQASAAPEPFSVMPESGGQLFDKLSALRKKIAGEAGVPPYVVFHDNTLREMERLLPLDLEAMKDISGVGRAKLEKYGDLFIEAILAHTEAA